MPRDASGNYTLPVGNPVVDGTIIETTWANPTMDDIALQLNNVLTRDGLLGPILPLKFVDGTSALPGIAFNSDPNTGIYLVSPDKLGFTVGGTTVFSLDASEAVFAVPPKWGTAPASGSTLTNKDYVDAAIAAAVGGIGGPYLPLAGGTLTGPPIYASAPGTGSTLTNRTYVDASIATAISGFGGPYLPLAGGTLTGNLVITTAAGLALTLNNPAASSKSFESTGTATGYNYWKISNTGGAMIIGVESSAGGGLATGAPGYATCLLSESATSLSLGTNNTSRMLIDSAGAVTFTGSITAAGDITAFSDDTVKTNWKDMDQWFVEDLAKVKAGIYDRTDVSLRQVGVSAQSLRHVMPEAVREAQDGSLSVNYGHAALVSCIALAREIVQLKARLQ